MKKMLLALAVLASSILYAATPKVDEKIEKNFKETFPNAEKVTWHENEVHYEVMFINETVKCRMIYNKTGEVLRTTRYYAEEGLCPFILARLKSKYTNKKVHGVTEVNNSEGIKYHIILEDENKWYFVDADSAGNMMVSKKYNKV